MPRNTSMTLGNYFADFISEQMQTGRYGLAGDVRAGLRLLEDHETKVRALQGALIAGEQSKAPRPFDKEAFPEPHALAKHPTKPDG